MLDVSEVVGGKLTPGDALPTAQWFVRRSRNDGRGTSAIAAWKRSPTAITSGQARIAVLAGDVLPGAPAVADAAQPRDAKAVRLEPVEQRSLPLRPPRPTVSSGFRTRSPQRHAVSLPPGEPLRLGRDAERRQDVRGRAHYAVRAASEATISASTLVSAGIASSRACARTAASSASRRAASTPCAPDVAVAVEQVVDDLEEQAELVAERAPRRLLALRHLGDPERDADRGGEERARLQPVQRREVGGVAGDVAVLAADHPQRRLGELAADHRRRIGERKPERLREQGVARQERRRLAEGDVGGGAAAALVVVVERGQVVVDERERVHELDRRGGGQDVLGGGARSLADRQRDHGPDALAAGFERIAQRLLEARPARA